MVNSKRLYLFASFILSTLTVFAQKEGNIWYFGINAGLDFSSGSPVVLNDSSHFINASAATICDSNGNLLFYTSGRRVWNRNHEIMPNGFTLSGDSASQSAVIIPQVNNKNRYYIFTVPSYYNQGSPDGLDYSIIDMSLDNGNGDVLTGSKDIALLDIVDEKIISLKKSDSEYWVLTRFNDTVYSFLIDASGISNPIKTVIEPKIVGATIPNGVHSCRGHMKFSPDGNKIVMAFYEYVYDDYYPGAVYMYDFDISTGIVSNPLYIGDYIDPYGVEFSRDGSKLYLTTGAYRYKPNSKSGTLYQFDLTSPNIKQTETVISVLPNRYYYGALQLALDDKIYVVKVQADEFANTIDITGSGYLSVIERPNEEANNIMFKEDNLFLNGSTCLWGLPANVESYSLSSVIVFEDNCAGNPAKFTLNDEVDSVVWSFGDPASGLNNESTDLEPEHVFSSPGEYEVSAITTVGLSTVTETTTVSISNMPVAYNIYNVQVCEDDISTGISSNIDMLNIESQVLGSQTGMVVSYFDSKGNKLPSPLPNPMANSTANLETITVRVANSNNLECYAETSFNFIVNPLPGINAVDDIYTCDDDYDGIAVFDIRHVESTLLGGQTGMLVDYFYQNGQQIASPLPNAISNIVQNQEAITARITNPITNCFNETAFNLFVYPLPIANTLDEIIGCDDNSDGISAYFDTSNIESTVLGGQTGMELSYYDSMGNFLTDTLPNPHTNSIPNEEIITVRVTNTQTSCYAETPLILRTSIKPQINHPQDVYICDDGNGISTFDLSFLENEIIGSQTGLNIYYFDADGNELTNQINSSFQNLEPWLHTIHVKVENASNNLCFSETSFNLIVDELPQVDIQDSYFICNLEPSLPLLINGNFDTWEWRYEDGSVISNSNEANLIYAGDYELIVTEFANGKVCENTFNFELVRSVLPTITNLDFQELTDDNYIKINASGDGEFEYSIDGVNFQNSNYFDGLLGGVYDVYVRDIYGCGEDTQQITIVDFPKYFTPNGDGINDDWQVKGIESYSKSDIYIFDRYGKLLKQLSPSSNGWDGTFNGNMMPSEDYWFKVILGDGREFVSHFSLKR